jgi:hypothetical protein
MIETLEGLVFPAIEWEVESVTGLTGPAKAGTFDIQATGPMTLHGVTKDLTIPVKLVIDKSGRITAESAFSISLEGWGIDRPTLLFIAIDDNIPIRVRMTFPGAGKFEFPHPRSQSNDSSPVPAVGTRDPADPGASGEPAPRGRPENLERGPDADRLGRRR